MSLTPNEQLTALEDRIGRVLRAGVVSSSVCLAAGIVVSSFAPGLAGVLLHAGVIVLISTPAARVVLSLVSFIRQRDAAFAGLTAIVLVELAASVIAALFFHARI